MNPIATTIYLLATLLTLTAVAALALLWMLRNARATADRARQQLERQQADIAALRDTERKARRTELGLREIARRMPLVVFTVERGPDRRHRLNFLAGDTRALFDLQPENLQNPEGLLDLAPLLGRVHHDSQADLRRLLLQAVRSRHVLTLDLRAYGGEGLRWIHLALVPHCSPEGRRQWSGCLIDTTGINLRNEALRVARDAAERASRAKADFLATMSHEIRTPMNGVTGMLELLGRTRLDAEQQELLRTVEDSAGVLLQILDDVLDFSKLEAGNLRLDVAPFDLRQLLDSVAGVMAPRLHARGQFLHVDMDAALAGTLSGDSVRIRQVLLNLLSNAAKFTERGGVTLTLRVLGDSDGVQRLRLAVTDTGIGIPADRQANLFTPFSQAESWTARCYGGTGLGLAICRYLVELMEGSIALDSTPGTGTTITVDLPLPVERREVEAPPGVAGRHAVVRLASARTAAALGSCLRALGLTVETIPPDQPMRTGLAANLLFVDAGDRESPAAIAAQAIEVDPADASPNGLPLDGERIRLGANPLKWQAVTRACVAGLEPLDPKARRSTRPAPPATARPANGANRRPILVAEDHPVSQALIHRQLELLGWPCDVVGDGRAALDALHARPYAMLLTDCQMPRMSGQELAIAWRRHERESGARTRLPILAMTASALDGETARCLDAGMDDCLSKPLQLQRLQEKIDTWMPPAPPDSQPSGDAAPIQAQDMLQVLLDTSRDDLAWIRQAIAAGDANTAAQRLHRLLGALQWFIDGDAIDEGRRRMEALQGDQANTALQELPPYLDTVRDVLATLRQTTAS